MRADVIVVGLGTMGSAAADVLSRRGVRVLGMDRWAPPHEHGAHAGGSRIIRLAYAEGAAYVPLLHRAYELWRDLELRAGRRLLTTTGALTIGRPDWPLVSGVLASAAEYGLECEPVDPGRFPQFSVAPDEVAVLDAAGGTLAPEAAIAACLDLAMAAGADLRRDVTVTGWSADASGVTVHTAGGDVVGDRLVLCAGAGAPALLAELGVPWRTERRLQHFWRPDSSSSGFPVWMWEYAPDVLAYGLPWQDPPGGLKAAFHDTGEPVDIRVGASPARPEEAEPMREWLRTRLPDLAAGAWLGATACLYTLTPDEHFIVGRHPAHPRVAVAAGFSGHGFKFLPVIGEILADLVLDGGTPHPIDLFDPARFQPR